MTVNELNGKYLALLDSGMKLERAARYLYDNYRVDVIDIMYKERELLPSIKTTIKPIKPAESLIDKPSKPLQSAETLTESIKGPAIETQAKTPRESQKSTANNLVRCYTETPRKSQGSTQSPADVLESYLKKRIALIPSKDKKPLIAYSKDESKLIRTLQDLEKWQEKGIEEFGFIPSKAGLIVIDLDNSSNHANKTNGIENFNRLLERSNLADKEIFRDFPRYFPCYTSTAGGGLHLYFSAEYLSESRLKEFDTQKLNAQNIEIKFNAKVTTAGSVINGKPYTLHGNLDDIPTMTIPIIDALSKPAQKPQHKTFARRSEKSDNRGLWNKTPQSIIDKAIEKYSGLEPHNFAYKTAVLFKLAGFDLQTAETYILNTPQHINRNDQKDTITAIESIFR